MWGLFKSLSLLALIAILLGISVAQSDDTPTPSLDVVVALDVSGSMDYPTDRNRYPAVDRALRVLADQRLIGDTRPATDPNALRFTAAETVLEWLAAYSRQYPDKVNVSASAISFSDSTQSLMAWQTLERNNDNVETFIDPLPRTSIRSTTTNQPQNSNFVALYDTLSNQFDNRDDDSRRSVILVTDSVPCYPTGVRDPNVPLYDNFCTDIPSMVRHINALNDLGRTTEHVIFINPLGAEHWGNSTFQTVKDAWERRLSSVGGSFREISNIEALPAAMMDVAMRELGVTLGVIDTDTAQPNDPVTPEQYIQMGVSYSASGTFAVPPFQSYMDVLTLLPASTANFSLTTPQNTDAAVTSLYGTDGKVIRIGRVNQPMPGNWIANAPLAQDTPTWAMFRAGQATLSVDGDVPAQYGTVRFRYMLTDHTGNPFPFTAETLPNITLEVTPPGSGNEPIILTNFSISPDDANVLISPPLLALNTGNYGLSLSVTEGDEAVWRTDANYAFLQPISLPSLTVNAVDFIAEYTVKGRVTASTDTTTAVNMPRSLPLEVRLKANPEGVLPEGLVARVIFTPPQDTNSINVCPQESVVLGIPENRSQAVSPEIRFDNDGACDLSVEVTFTSPLPPLNGAIETIRTSGNRRTVTVTRTQRLTYRLLQADGKTPVTMDTESASFTLNAPYDLGFTPNELRLRVEVLSENGRLTAPAFLAGEVGPNRQNCRVPSDSAASPSSEGETSTEPLSADISGQKVVPFRLVVTNSAAQDVAALNGVCLYATDLDGVYQAVLNGLGPDTYMVQVVLDNTSPRLDYERFEWHPDLFPEGFNVPHQVSAVIQVNPNLGVWGVYGGAAFVALLLVILIIILLRRRQQKVTAPLNGWPTLYYVDEENLLMVDSASNSLYDEPQEPVWKAEPAPVNTLSYQARDFLNPKLIPLDIEMLTLTTRRQEAVSEKRGFYYEMKRRNGMQKPDRPLNPNDVVEIAQTELGNRFFLVNRVNGSQKLTLRELLKQPRGIDQPDKDENAS